MFGQPEKTTGYAAAEQPVLDGRLPCRLSSGVERPMRLLRGKRLGSLTQRRTRQQWPPRTVPLGDGRPAPPDAPASRSCRRYLVTLDVIDPMTSDALPKASSRSAIQWRRAISAKSL